MDSERLRIKQELASVGIDVNSIYDLVNTSQPYPQAIPVLVNLVESGVINDERLKEGIFRALTVKEAKGKIGKFLIDQYNKTPKEKNILRWVIGNTMTKAITENDFESISEIVKNKENGMSRQMFVIALGKFKSPKAEELLIELLGDDEVAPHAIDALGTMRSLKAKGKILDLLNSPDSLIKKEAHKALKKISQQ